MGTMAHPNRIIGEKHDYIQIGEVTVNSKEASTKQRKFRKEFLEHGANTVDLFL